MSRFELVVFDNDGVLVDSEPISARVLASLLTEAGLPTTPEECRARFLGNAMDRVVREAEARLGRPLPPFFLERYEDRLFEALRRELRPVPGVRAVLAGLDLPTCVASSASPAKVRLTLEVAGLLPFFGDRLFSASAVGRGKPDPGVFLLAARTLGVRPERCCVVEDSPVGIEAARRAGMTSFGFARRTPPEDLAGATGGVFRSMEQLPGLLGVSS